MEREDGGGLRCPSSSDALGPFIAELARLYWRKLYVYTAGLTGSSHDAEEIVQEVFLRAYRSRTRLTRSAGLACWLYKVAANLCRNRLRSRRRRREVNRPADFDEPAVSSDALSIYERKIALGRVRDAVGSLPVEHREVIYLRYMERLKYSEIAHVLGISCGAVASRIYRAKEILRRALADVGVP